MEPILLIIICFVLIIIINVLISNTKWSVVLAVTLTFAIQEIASPALQGIGEDIISKESTINAEEDIVEENTEKSTEESTVESTTEEYITEVTTEESVVSEKDTEDKEGDTEDEFIFPDSDKRMLLKSELEGKNEWECKIGRNEIFARRGKIFDDPELQEYFENCSWYEGKNSQYEYSEYISEIEAYNVQLIREYENEHGYNPELNVPE